MKYFLLLAVCLFSCGYILAQDTAVIFLEPNEPTLDTILVDNTNDVILLVDVMENVIIHQDSTIYQLLLDKYIGKQRGQKEVNGFRVQVYSSNSQQLAKNESLLLYQEMEKKISEPLYIISEPPFWKVRIGNFLTREEANQYKEVLLNLFPELNSGTYVVPDKIIVIK